MSEWLVSLSGEIGTKQPGTRRALGALVCEGLRSRAEAAGLSLSLEEAKGRFIVRAEEDISPLLLSQFGLSRVARLWRLREFSPKALPLKDLLPPRPFTYVVYVDRVEEKALWSRALALKKACLASLEEASRKRLSLWDNYPPERLELRLEVWKEGAWLLVNPEKAPGGFPVGSGERVLVLFSGGPDSLLAAYLLGRRGQEVSLLFLDDEASGRLPMVREAAQGLSYFFPGQEIVLLRLSYRSLLEELVDTAPTRERCLFCKRLMLELAVDLARRQGFSAVATGEILGEQASQTLPALRFTGGGGDILVLRPVLTWNKEEVLTRLREIGLGQVAERRLPPCPLAGRHPHTRPKTPPERAASLIRKLKKLCPPPEKMFLSWGRRSL